MPAIALAPLAAPAPVRLGQNGASAEDRSRNQCERILFATAQCCYEQGYARTSIGDIIARAAVSRSVFYEHFRQAATAYGFFAACRFDLPVR